MNRKEFGTFLTEELSKEQLAILSFAFMYNPDHIDYYIAFKSEDYDACKQYVIDNKDSISIENVPENLMPMAKGNISMFNSMSDEKVHEMYINA